MTDWRDQDPGLPIKLGPCSNGEYDPEPLSPVLTEVVRRAREACDENAERLGMSRREFLLSMCGAATTLFVLDAITARAEASPPGGRYLIPREAMLEPEAAEALLGGDGFVMDIQGHLLEYDLNPATRGRRFFGSVFPQVDCGEEDPRACFSIEHFMEEFFLRSDTSMVVLSALPIHPEGSPLSMEVMEETRRVALGLSRDRRVLLHAQALPHLGTLPANLEAMEATVAGHPVVGWKTFTHFPDPATGLGWWLDDHEPGVPQVGEAFLRRSAELGIRNVCIHKGFSGRSRFGSPRDVGPAARAHPDLNFLIYHSGFEARTPEGPYTEATAHLGVNRLISSLIEAGIGPNQNVYAELGSTWWYLMRTPSQAAHVLGKLLRYVGEDNVLWGTDSIFYGSPQDQIQAFRAFQISPELRDRYGYPPLTRRVKDKILGANAARVYGVDPVTVPFTFTGQELDEIRRSLPGRHRTYGPADMTELRAFEEHHQGWP
ncbi:MAG: amidohydrolase family protein [Acidimicrobiia bacterium]